MRFHKPVMVDEVIRYLQPEKGDIMVDCTVGTAGHSYEIAKLILPQGRLIAIDQDEEVLAFTRKRLKEFKNYQIVHQNFKNIDLILEELGLKKGEIDGFLFDLGVSSFQLDSPERGFSFRFSGYLDMRMNRENSVTAFDLVNNLTAEELERIFREYSQERYARRIAKAIIKAREKETISTTIQLADIIKRAVPTRTSIHPATRVFQALRIVVNQELESLSSALKKAVEFLKPGGRICVISFHSGEDRIVKNEFRHFAQSRLLNIITKKPVLPSAQEITANPRVRSAKLRVGERI